MRQALSYLLALAAGLVISLLAPGTASGWEALIEPALFILMVCTFAELPLAQRDTKPLTTRQLRDDARPTSKFLLLLAACNFLVVPGIVFTLLAALKWKYGSASFTGPSVTPEAVVLPAALVMLAPCIDYVVPFTKQMGGNFLRLLAATPVLLIGQILVVPLWLWLLGMHLEVSQAWPVARAALLFLVLPLALVTLLRGQRWLQKCSERVMDPAMWLVLGAIAAAYGAEVLHNHDALAPLMATYAVFALLAFSLSGVVALMVHLQTEDRIAVSMSAMTRNSLVVLPIAVAVAPVREIAVIVVVSQTAVELLMISLMLALRKIRL